MDNNRIPRATSLEDDLQNIISNYITDNLERFLQNDRTRTRTTERTRDILTNINTSDNNMFRIVESLNSNMLMYHMNISDYLNNMNRILDNIQDSNRVNQTSRGVDEQPGSSNRNSDSFTNANNMNNSNNNNTEQQPPLQARSTYYYRTTPLLNSPILRRRLYANRSPNLSRRNIPEPTSPIQNNRILNSRRSPFTMLQYLSNNTTANVDPFRSNELMQEYFQNLFQNPSLFQNVIVSPTSEQITNATETVLYDSNMNFINERCPITLEEFQENERVVRIIHCGHTFGESSIQNWFRTNVRCPVCRFDIRDAPMTTDSDESFDIEYNNNNNNNNSNNNNNNNSTSANTDNDIEDIIQEELYDEDDEFNDGDELGESLPPSPTAMQRTSSELTTSTTSTINNNLEGFWHELANNIRDNLSDNIETIMQSNNQPIASHIQIEIPIMNEDFDISNNYTYHTTTYELP